MPRLVRTIIYLALTLAVLVPAASGCSWITGRENGETADKSECRHANTAAYLEVAPTCTETGHTGGLRCLDCGATLEEQITILATGHREKHVECIPATCTEPGHTEGVICSVCGEVFSGLDTIPVTGHDEVTVPGRAATKTSDGLTNGIRCSVCGETLKAQEKLKYAPVISDLPADSSEMSKDLALELVGLCGDGSRSGTASLLGDISFDVFFTGNYDKDSSDRSHTCAYTVGKRNYNGRNYYIIVIRATSGGEWYSNFDFAPSHSNDTQYAENFYLAAQDIMNSVKGFLDADPDKTVIVCGHSRGASTANLLGVMLDGLYGENDVYVYTFATPMTVRGAAAGKQYGNIFNFINRNDIVTCLPPEQYGYSRAGTDVMMSSVSSAGSVLDLFSSLCELAPDIRSYYEVRYSLKSPGTSPDGMSVYDLMCVFAGYLASGKPDLPTGDFTPGMVTSDLFPVFLRMASLYGSSGLDIAAEHVTERYAELIASL